MAAPDKPVIPKAQLYPMRWKHVELSRNKVACAPFRAIVQLYAESALRKLRIFNSAGVLLSKQSGNTPQADRSECHGPKTKP
ncbi:hypothetical protein SADUNF_Sadunf02G0048600 [Salix dunnii]|uniref:Uncharacterized protein n=1 Tax=Salix dunnii TaxID=1413687 RepID=A0A835THW6_9ROSI|nr:hypothetical protein SADUNF_Sadunf02G0048600 [Salix dunnii]